MNILLNFQKLILKMNKLSKLILLLFLTSSVFAQSNKMAELPFKPGEKLSYIASYNMKGLMTELAGIDMEVINVPGKEKPIYRLKLLANTLTSWDDYVKVRHAYQTYIDVATVKPLVMAQDSDVKGEVTTAKYKFKHKTGLVNLETKKNGEVKPNKQIKFGNNTFDIVSMIYYTRSLDYKNMKVGTSTPINLIALEQALPLKLNYMGIENIKTEKYGEIPCYKVAVALSRKFVVEPNVTFIWITKDEKQIPVQISTIFKEGNALVKLK